MTAAKKPSDKPSGPEPERLKIMGDWEDAASQVVKVPRPAKGWPKPTTKKKTRKKK